MNFITHNHGPNMRHSVTSTSNIQNKDKASYSPKFIFVVQLHNGKYCVGAGNNVCRRIANLNSGSNPAVPDQLQINRIIGVKEVTPERNLITVVKHFINKFGEDKVIAL